MSAHAETQTPQQPGNKKGKRKGALLALTLLFVIIAVAYGIYWFLVLRHYENTDDAYVAGNQVQIMSQVSGSVTKVWADNTDFVKQGDVLVTLDQADAEHHSIQPSELSCALGSSRTNATRIADELEKRGWIERRESDNDRRCLHLHLTEKGQEFLRQVLPPQHHCLHELWSSLSGSEKEQLEQITRKLLTRLDEMDENQTVLEAVR